MQHGVKLCFGRHPSTVSLCSLIPNKGWEVCGESGPLDFDPFSLGGVSTCTFTTTRTRDFDCFIAGEENKRKKRKIH